MKKKQAIVKKIVAALLQEHERLSRAARASHSEATHEQSKAEHKYDTRGLEAAYLAGGQARKVAELEDSIELFQKLKLTEFAPATPIDLGALVELDLRGVRNWYFLAPRGGGLEIIHGGEEITVITPQSPIGSQILEKRQGEQFQINLGGAPADCRIISVA